MNITGMGALRSKLRILFYFCNLFPVHPYNNIGLERLPAFEKFSPLEQVNPYKQIATVKPANCD